MRGRPLTLARLTAAVSGTMGWAQLNRFFDASASRKAAVPRRPATQAERAPKPTPAKRGMRKTTAASKITRPPAVPDIQWRAAPKTRRYDDIVLKYAEMYKLDPRLIKAVIAAESSFRRKVVSKAGALGLMQLMPVTAEEMGVPRTMLFDPEANIRAGAAYLAHLFERIFRKHGYARRDFRDAPRWMIGRVLAAYNAGPRFLYRTRWYRVTRRYVSKVFQYYRSALTTIAQAIAPEETIPTLSAGKPKEPGPPPNCRSLPKDGLAPARLSAQPRGSAACRREGRPQRIQVLIARPIVGAGAVHMRHALEPANE